MTNDEILENLYAAQNDLWLELWEIAAKWDPDATARIAKQLNANDDQIGKLLGEKDDRDSWQEDCDGP